MFTEASLGAYGFGVSPSLFSSFRINLAIWVRNRDVEDRIYSKTVDI